MGQRDLPIQLLLHLKPQNITGANKIRAANNRGTDADQRSAQQEIAIYKHTYTTNKDIDTTSLTRDGLIYNDATLYNLNIAKTLKQRTNDVMQSNEIDAQILISALLSKAFVHAIDPKPNQT
jgi:uroporphyrinogen-III synthase